MAEVVRRAAGVGREPADLLPMVFARPKDALAGARAILAGDPSRYDASIAYHVIGIVERDFGDIAAAVAHLRHAARLARQARSPVRETEVLGTLGLALVHSGRTATGLSTFDRAIRLAHGVPVARVRYLRALALWILGRHEPALDDLRRALPVLRRARDSIWTGRVLTVRALIYLASGSTARADQDVTAAEQLFAAMHQEHDVAVAVHNRALVAFRAGDLPATLLYLDDAARRYQALGTPMPDLYLDRCAVLLTAGLPGEALRQADAGLERLESLRGQATRKAELLLAAARAALAAGDPATARARAGAALRLFAAQGRDWWTAHTRLLLLQSHFAAGVSTSRLMREATRTAHRLATLGSAESAEAHLLAGRAALKLHRPDEADRHLAAAAQARRHGPPIARATGWLAEALRADAAGQSRRSLEACRRGLDVLHLHQLSLGNAELRAQSTTRGTDLAVLAQRICLRAGRTRQLLIWCERWRATALAVPPVRPPHDRVLLTELARYREITSRLDNARADGRAVPRLHREQQQAERNIRARARHLPGEPASAGVDRSVDIDALLAELHSGRMVELVEVDGYLHAVLCGAGRVRRFPVGPMEDAVDELGHARAALHRLALRASVRPDTAVAQLDSSGRQLERLLLGPAARHLDGGPVVIVPPARLTGVPWALLPSLRRLPLSVAPSARAWLRARALTEPKHHRVVLVSGPALAAGAAEVAAIAGMYDRVTVLERDSATAARVLDAVDGSWLAHIAAHGTFRSDSPLFSALRMVDGPVTVYDFERLQTAPYRLVLPSCDSARLAPVGSDELLGLAAALLPLGTATIVASVLPVDDEATAELMRCLHGRLRHGTSMAEALHAVRDTAASDPYATAAAWSFLTIGAG